MRTPWDTGRNRRVRLNKSEQSQKTTYRPTKERDAVGSRGTGWMSSPCRNVRLRYNIRLVLQYPTRFFASELQTFLPAWINYISNSSVYTCNELHRSWENVASQKCPTFCFFRLAIKHRNRIFLITYHLKTGRQPIIRIYRINLNVFQYNQTFINF